MRNQKPIKIGKSIGTYLLKLVKFHEINALVDNFISTIKKLNGH